MIWVVGLAAGLVCLLLFLRSQWLAAAIWRVYGYTYDGLLDFWPYQNLLKLMLERLDLRDGQRLRLLDLGCGTGNLINRSTDFDGVEAVGVDVSETMLRVGRQKLARQIKNGRVELHQQDIVQYLKGALPRQYDRIASINVIYAINDRSELWSEMLRVLKPGGRIVITTSVRHGSLPIIREHLRHQPAPKWVTGKLLGVFIIDALINLLGRTGSFSFANESMLKKEIAAAGGIWGKSITCYGGEKKGVNLMVDVTKAG